MNVAFLGYSGHNRFTAAIRELDLASGSIAGLHLVIACAWLFSFGVGRAPEGILFGALIGISLIRSPSTLPLLLEALKSCRSVLICLGLLLFIGISAAWSPAEAKADWYPPRHMLYPVLLMPLLGGWRRLAWAYLAGIAFQASWILIEYMIVADYHYGYPLGSSSNVHFWGGHMATGAILSACLALNASGQVWPRAIAVVIFSTCLAAALIIGGRTTALALALGLTAAGAWASARTSVGWKIPCALLACALAAGVAFGATLTARFQVPSPGADSTPLCTRLHAFTSGRTWMWQVSLSAGSTHPWAGWGRDAWAVVFHQRVAELPPADLWFTTDQAMGLNTAHSSYVQALIDQGVIGLGLVIACIIALVATAWRSSSALALPLMGLTVYWAVSGIMLSELNTSHGLVPFGLMMTFAVGAVMFPGSAQPTHEA